EEAVAALPSVIVSGEVAAWIRERETGAFRLVSSLGISPTFAHKLADHAVPANTAAQFLLSIEEPFVVPKEVVATVPHEYLLFDEVRHTLVGPTRWEPDGVGAVTGPAPPPHATLT